MIIFDLDGTLSDCEHRRHLVDPEKAFDMDITEYFHPENYESRCYWSWKGTDKKWKPDWDAFYEACDKDKPIEPVCEAFLSLAYEPSNREVRIWSGRSDKVRSKTIKWIENNIPEFEKWGYINRILLMRPVGDSSPDDVLKERWLDELIAKGEKVDFVFDDRPKVIRMWRRRGIFVFNCNQTEEEF